MLIQVPAATKIVGLILCGVLMLGNAANNVVGMVSGNSYPEIHKDRWGYEIVDRSGDLELRIYIPENVDRENFLNNTTIQDIKEKTFTYWREEDFWDGKYEDWDEYYNETLNPEQKQLYEKYVKITENEKYFNTFMKQIMKKVEK